MFDNCADRKLLQTCEELAIMSQSLNEAMCTWIFTAQVHPSD